MKKLIVIGAYPNTPKKYEVLMNQLCSLSSLKSSGFDFMLVTHYPATVEMQEMVDYYIFDKNQTLTPLDKTTYFWFKTSSFFLRINNSRHALPISQSMNNAFKFSEIKNYDFVYFIENDNWFSENDIKKLDELVDIMFKENKKCIFFKPETYLDNDSHVYETQLFGITPKYFNKVFNLPITEEEYFYHYAYPVSLELGFYNNLSKYENDFLIIDKHSYEYFNDSNINIFRVESLLFEVVYNSKNPTQPIFFCFGNSIKENTYKIVVKLNDEVISNTVVNPQNWFYQPLEINGDKLTIELYCDDTLQEIKSYILDESIILDLKNKGIIEFN